MPRKELRSTAGYCGTYDASQGLRKSVPITLRIPAASRAAARNPLPQPMSMSATAIDIKPAAVEEPPIVRHVGHEDVSLGKLSRRRVGGGFDACTRSKGITEPRKDLIENDEIVLGKDFAQQEVGRRRGAGRLRMSRQASALRLDHSSRHRNGRTERRHRVWMIGCPSLSREHSRLGWRNWPATLSAALTTVSR